MSTAESTVRPVLIAGEWRQAKYEQTFKATDPNKNALLPTEFPVSLWEDCDAALEAASDAASKLRQLPADKIADFLECYADRIEAAKDALVEAAFSETGLARSPRLADVELPRTSNQLRAAAQACRTGKLGDGNVRYKDRNSILLRSSRTGLHLWPQQLSLCLRKCFRRRLCCRNRRGQSRDRKGKQFASRNHLSARQTKPLEAAKETGLPAATVQLLYRTSHADGERMVADSRVGATGYTGSRNAGLKLKAAADQAGKPIYLELSSVNPVVMTSGASVRAL